MEKAKNSRCFLPFSKNFNAQNRSWKHLCWIHSDNSENLTHMTVQLFLLLASFGYSHNARKHGYSFLIPPHRSDVTFLTLLHENNRNVIFPSISFTNRLFLWALTGILLITSSCVLVFCDFYRHWPEKSVNLLLILAQPWWMETHSFAFS